MDEIQFSRVLNALVQLFFEDRVLLETRGALIIRKLCSLLDCKSIFMSLASILTEKTDIEFLSTLVQTANLILLTAPELSPLRNTLKNCFVTTSSSASISTGGGNGAPSSDSANGSQESDQVIFFTLFKCWCHNPVATFSLCLLSQAYDLSAALVIKFAEVDITVGFLMQIDKLVQLLESPVFVRLRLQLLEVTSDYHPDLLKSLYGVLMLLPQSQAYKTLSDRLATVSSLKMHLSLPSGASVAPNLRISNSSASDSKAILNKSASKLYDFQSLLNHFEETQRRHLDFRMALVQEKGLFKHRNLRSSSVDGVTIIASSTTATSTPAVTNISTIPATTTTML